jgi:hypothetical protein
MLSNPQQYPMYPAQKRDTSQWGGSAKDKRFMVSRKRQASIDHVNKLLHDSAYKV